MQTKTMTLKVTSGADVAIKPEEIPDRRADWLARETLRAVKRLFDIPGVQEDFEKWLPVYREEQKRKRVETAGVNA